MHELPIVNQVLKTVLKYGEEEKCQKILSVKLVIGDMHDLVDEWVIKYFGFASRGTMAEGAEVIIERVPIICQCSSCEEYFIVRLRDTAIAQCPVCKSTEFTRCSGDEFSIEGIEVC